MLTSKTELLELSKRGQLTPEHIAELTTLGIRYLELMELIKMNGLERNEVVIEQMEPESITEMTPKSQTITFKSLLGQMVMCPCGSKGKLYESNTQGFYIQHEDSRHNLKRKIKKGLAPSEIEL